MTQKISKTSKLNSNVESYDKSVHENIHSNHTITNFDVNNNIENYENGNGSPLDIRKSSENHSFVYHEESSASNKEPQLQMPLQNPIRSNEISKEYSQDNSQRGCVDISLDIDFDIFWRISDIHPSQKCLTI